MSAKVVQKTEPGERVGVFARVNGAMRVVEYSDLPEALASVRDADGQLRYAAGNVAQHVLDRDFVARLAAAEGDPADPFALPLHRAQKVINTWDPVAGAVQATQAVKLERFVFDAMARCVRPALLAVPRAEAFAPIKNAEGADSPATSAASQVARAARWLAAAGVQVPRDTHGAPDCILELSALTALEGADLKAISDLPAAILPGERWSR
jgi:UDP-N-acetylglucosamine/UDP-N-acetylgalactosamine diphosphorylase